MHLGASIISGRTHVCACLMRSPKVSSPYQNQQLRSSTEELPSRREKGLAVPFACLLSARSFKCPVMEPARYSSSAPFNLPVTLAVVWTQGLVSVGASCGHDASLGRTCGAAGLDRGGGSAGWDRPRADGRARAFRVRLPVWASAGEPARTAWPTSSGSFESTERGAVKKSKLQFCSPPGVGERRADFFAEFWLSHSFPSQPGTSGDDHEDKADASGSLDSVQLMQPTIRSGGDLHGRNN